MLSAAGSAVQAALLVGLLFSLLTLGLLVSFRILDFPDLGVEGVAIFGAAVSYGWSAHGGSPFIALGVAAVSGALAGAFTACQFLYAGTSKLLAGIITTSVMYSLSIHVMGGRANRRIADSGSIFSAMSVHRSSLSDLVVLFGCVAAIALAIIFVMSTRIGYLWRVLGNNERFLSMLGERRETVLISGLSFSNAVVAVGGALIAQFKTTSDVTLVSGLLVSALAAVVLGELAVRPRSIHRAVLGAVVGTILYNFVIAVVLFSWRPSWDRVLLGSDVRLVGGVVLLLGTIAGRRMGVRDGGKMFSSNW